MTVNQWSLTLLIVGVVAAVVARVLFKWNKDQGILFMNDGIETLAFVLTMAGAVMLIVSGALFLSNASGRATCASTAKSIGVEWQYPNMNAGCLVNIKGRWVPLDNWRSVN